MTPLPMKTETRTQFLERCKTSGVKDMKDCVQAWTREAKKTK